MFHPFKKDENGVTAFSRAFSEAGEELRSDLEFLRDDIREGYEEGLMTGIGRTLIVAPLATVYSVGGAAGTALYHLTHA